MNEKSIVQQYQEGFTAKEIASSLEVGIKTVYSTLKRFGVQRRSPASSNTLRYRRSKTSFQKPETLTHDENCLKIAALALYWGEGYKGERSNTVDLANSDPAIIKVFLRFLREILHVDELRLRVYLYCFSDQDTTDLIRYWSGELGIPRSQFQKPYIRPMEPSIRKMRYGLVHVRYSDKRLLEYLVQEIKQMKLWAGCRAVKCTRL